MTSASEVINWLIQKYKYQSYLEIGSRHLVTFNKIVCEKKVGVDPSFNATFKMKSDTFFKQNSDVFDIVFIDGDHSGGQVRKDILNSLECLSENGTIVLHDVNPREERLLQQQLCHDAWWAFAQLRSERSDLFMCALDFDYIGIIQKGSQTVYPKKPEKNWKYLDGNRKELMNEMSWEEFIAMKTHVLKG